MAKCKIGFARQLEIRLTFHTLTVLIAIQKSLENINKFVNKINRLSGNHFEFLSYNAKGNWIFGRNHNFRFRDKDMNLQCRRELDILLECVASSRLWEHGRSGEEELPFVQGFSPTGTPGRTRRWPRWWWRTWWRLKNIVESGKCFGECVCQQGSNTKGVESHFSRIEKERIEKYL